MLMIVDMVFSFVKKNNEPQWRRKFRFQHRNSGAAT
jgi:hypothetical protein